MKSIKKTLFWALVALLICLACLALILAGYVFLMPQKTVEDGPYIVYDYPTEIVTPDIKATSIVLYNEAKKLYQTGEYDKTLDILDRLIALNPDDPGLYRDRANTFRGASGGKTNLTDYLDLLQRGVADADKGLALDPKSGELYLLRAILFGDMSNVYAYRADREYILQLVIENFEAANSLRTENVQYPERYLVNYYAANHECERALTEAQRLASLNTNDGLDSPYIETIFENAYACSGNYEKALEYYQARIKRLGNEEGDQNCVCSGRYLYQLGRFDELLEKLNKSIEKKPHYNGARYFLRAVIEFDRGDYDAALQDVYKAEGNSWAFGTLASYIEGLNDARLGNKEKAIKELQYAEATMFYDYYFAIERAREELKKLNATPLEITPSVNISATPLPVFPTPDLKKYPTPTLPPSQRQPQ